MTPWIVISGLDGSGKTTLLNDLTEYLKEQDLRVKNSRLPHDKYLVDTLLNVSNDPYTDRMLFALDNRIFAEKYKTWQKEEYDFIITQRGFLDSFVHGAVQGFSYSQIAQLNQIQDLPKCTVIIHLVAEATVAYERIKGDPLADKFEYIEYIRKQETETRRAYKELCKKNEDLSHFSDAINLYVDTTYKTTQEVFECVLEKLVALKIFENKILQYA